MKKQLALVGGEPFLKSRPAKELGIFKWPVITEEDEQAALKVIRENAFSGIKYTEEFQEKFAKWLGVKHALAYPNGTMALSAAMFAIGLGAGDEIICPTKTYWGSVSQAMCFGASAVFCNINEHLVIDPDDIERCITKRTKAIMVVHYNGYPCDMDKIMSIAKKHNLYVIEDVSHAQGSLYKGKKCGTFGDINAMSMMSGKTFACGELGMVVSDNTKLYERAIAYGHYDRITPAYITESTDLFEYSHIALGGVKGRANQLCSVLGMGQLKHFDERIAECNKAMNYFFDLCEGIPGLEPDRCDTSDGSSMGGFYCAHFMYDRTKFKGLSSKRFAQALRAESENAVLAWEGGNYCLHTHNLFKTFDFFNLGKPSRIVFNDRDVREDDKYLKRSEDYELIGVPVFRKFNKEWIEKYAEVVKIVAENYEQLLEGDIDKEAGGRWHGFENAVDQQKKK